MSGKVLQKFVVLSTNTSEINTTTSGKYIWTLEKERLPSHIQN